MPKKKWIFHTIIFSVSKTKIDYIISLLESNKIPNWKMLENKTKLIKEKKNKSNPNYNKMGVFV